MTKINTIDMVYHVPSNHTLLPTNTGVLGGVSQPTNPIYLNSTNITTTTTQLIYTNNNKRYFDFNGTSRSVRSTTTVSYTKYSNIQFDCDFILRTKKRHVLYCVGTGGTTANETISVFEVYINNTTNKIVVELGSKSFTTDYKFDINVEYNILVTVSMDRGLLVNINGESVSNFDYVLSKSALMSIESGNYYHIIGNNIASGSTGNPNVGLDGYMTNVYSSFGGIFIHRDHTDYTSNPYNKLLQFNMLNDGIGTSGNNNSKFDVVNTLGVNFNYSNATVGFYKVDSPVWFGINNSYYVKFGLGINNSLDNVLLFTNNQYEVRLSGIYTDLNPEPKVVVNEYTKSALNFENDIIDQVGTTVWNKGGTATVQNINKIFGENSFETKALGDSVYTNSNIITGGTTPFTIEFYALIKGRDLNSSRDQAYYLFSKNNNVSGGDQKFFVSKEGDLTYQYYNGTAWVVAVGNNNKCLLNEINKYTLSYDGASLRGFLNEKLCFTLGKNQGILTNVSEPYTFLRSYLPSYASNSNTTYGLIDNINVFDGEARVVRDPDPYEEFLIVDLAFDGENNSTKIVDNGTAKLNCTVSGNAKISTDQKFDGFSSLYLQNTTDYISTNSNVFNFGKSDFTLSFNIIRLSDTKFDVILTHDRDGNGSYDTLSLIAIYPSTNATYPNKLYLFGQKNINGERIPYISNNGVPANINYKIDLIVKNETLYIYMNNKLDSTHILTNNLDFSRNSIAYLGYYSWDIPSSFNGYVKNFKIYKGVAVIPENPTGKIQLDFDNNLIDKYNNSTWTNSGVTFDQVNSVKGYAAYFDTSTDYIETSSSSLNFADKNFKIDFDFKPNSFYSSGELLSGNTTSDSTNTSRFFIYCNDAGLALGIYANNETITSGSIKIYNNIWYNSEFVRVGNNIFTKRNDALINCRNVNFNLNLNNASFRLGNPNVSFGSTNNGINGYLDNFKSYKEDLTSELDKYYVGTSSSYIMNNLLKLSSSASSGLWVKEKDNLSIKNFKLDVIYSKESGDNSIIFRTTSWNNTNDTFAYIINISPNTIGFAKGSNATSGAFSWLKTTSFTSSFNKDYKLTIIANETYIEVYVDDVLYLTHNDSTYNISGYIGLRSYGTCVTYYKSMIIYDLSGNELYHKDWKSKIDNVVDRPAVHLPLETNATNVGFAALTINSVGSPTYTTVDGKKCIKFESGKYLTINSNNIFNLGTSSDFYIELDINIISFLTYNMIMTNNNSWANGSQSIWITNTGKISIQSFSGLYKETTNSISLNTWYTIKLYRKGNIYSVSINDIIESFIINDSINLSINSLYIGCSGWSPNSDRLNGYMSNFKMFVGTSEVPETYNDKKVIDLDFKPTGKSYLFKDNNNKCVIHPVNITQRDYQNSQYCCTFNGTNQYLQLGKNDLFNFGNDDFVINVRVGINDLTASNKDDIILSNNISWGTGYVGIGRYRQTNKLSVGVFGTSGYNSSNTFNLGINDIIITRNGSILTINLNGVETVFDNFVNVVNFNGNDSTRVGMAWDSSDTYFKGTIYSIKVLRNTTDLTLLQGEVTQTTSFDYKIINTETLDEQVIQSDNKTPDIEIERNETDVILTVDNQPISIPSDPTIIEGSSIELFTGYTDTIKYDLVVYDQKPTTASSYVIPELDYSPIEVMDVDGIDSIDVIQYQDAGDHIIDGFTEGHPDAKFRIVNRYNNMVLVTGSDTYYLNGINELYIQNYYVDLYELGIQYPLEDHKMVRGYITYYMSTANQCVGSEYCVRLMRRVDGRIIGNYEFTGDYCTITNLDCNVAYDAILFDKMNRYESISMSNRIPRPVE